MTPQQGSYAPPGRRQARIILSLVLLGVVALVARVVWRSTRWVCTDEVVQTVRSPSGSRKALVFERHCGATTGYATQLSVVPSWMPLLPLRPGNALIVDAPARRAELRVRWVAADTLLVTHGSAVPVFVGDSALWGVRVKVRKEGA
jgi:hypothetical protein